MNYAPTLTRTDADQEEFELYTEYWKGEWEATKSRDDEAYDPTGNDLDDWLTGLRAGQ